MASKVHGSDERTARAVSALAHVAMAEMEQAWRFRDEDEEP
jgi:hypothetical protein